MFGVLVTSTKPISCISLVISIVFFFQAEDGIRDHCVTGVQTCALPICAPFPRLVTPFHFIALPMARRILRNFPIPQSKRSSAAHTKRERQKRSRVSTRRSEERRVGKECRSRWSPYH